MRRGAWFLPFILLAAPWAVAQGELPLPPEQQHVTLAENGLVVQWAVVGRQYTEADLPAVHWSTQDDAGVVLAELVGVVAPGASRLGGGDLPLHTYVYAATVPVAPGETVTYQVGADGAGYAQPITTARPGPASATMRFAALGDIGVDATGPDGGCTGGVETDPPGFSQDCPAHAIRDAIIAQDPDLVVVPGDLAYANSRQGWDSFMRFMTPLQSRVPTMPVAGNHEYHASLGYSQFLAEYVLPGDEHRFTFQAGPVTFVGINSDAICGPHQPPTGPPQDICAGGHLSPDYTEWVRQALEDAARDETPWTVLYMHHPPYSYGRHGDHEGLQMLYQDWIERYGVDIVLTAHDHLYSRSHPMVGGEPTRNGSIYVQGAGPIYLVTGGGGRGLYPQPATPPPAWFAAGASVHHFTMFHVEPNSMQVRAVTIDGTELDAFTIISVPTPRMQDPERLVPMPGSLALLGLAAVAVGRLRR